MNMGISRPYYSEVFHVHCFSLHFNLWKLRALPFGISRCGNLWRPRVQLLGSWKIWTKNTLEMRVLIVYNCGNAQCVLDKL